MTSTMLPCTRSKACVAAACLTLSCLFLHRPTLLIARSDEFSLSLDSAPEAGIGGQIRFEASPDNVIPSSVHWMNGNEFFPVTSYASLPTARPKPLPQIQYNFASDNEGDGEVVRMDVDAIRGRIRDSFLKAWRSYTDLAWMHDELAPLRGGFRDPLGGWAATLIDALDTLWIMDLEGDFEYAVRAVEKIDFTTSIRPDIPIQEATVRYLGGLLGAYDISKGQYPVLLEKATQLGDVLLGAFDTPNRMPINFYAWQPHHTAKPHRASSESTLAELASLSLEFTRLSQLTGNAKYFDAVARITSALRAWQPRTNLPGLWPAFVDASGCKRSSSRIDRACSDMGLATSPQMAEDVFTLAGVSGPAYSALLKQYMLLGGGQQLKLEQEQDEHHHHHQARMYGDAVDAIKEKLLFRPLAGGSPDVLMLGTWYYDKKAPWRSTDQNVFEPEVSRSACNTGAMFALGAVVLGRRQQHQQPTEGNSANNNSNSLVEDELEIAAKLTEGCLWAHETSRSGLMPAEFLMMACESRSDCPWELDQFHDWWDALDLRMHPDFDLDSYTETEFGAKGEGQQGQGALDTVVEEDVAEAIEMRGPGIDEADGFQKTAEEEILYDDLGRRRRKGKSRKRHDSLHSQTVTHPPPVLAHEDFVRVRIWEEGLAEGMLDIHSRGFDLGHETVESLFTLYRITGVETWRDKAVHLFDTIDRMTETRYGNARLLDVTAEEHDRVFEDVMQSWWLAGTLKYFYLLFSDPEKVSLDEFVMNAEGHPFRLPR